MVTVLLVNDDPDHYESWRGPSHGKSLAILVDGTYHHCGSTSDKVHLSLM